MGNLQNINLNIGVISDIIFDPYLIPLMKACFGENINIYPIPYGEQNDETYREQIKESDMILVWLNLEASYLHDFDVLCLQPDSEQQMMEDVFTFCMELYADISAFSNAIILWFLLEDYFIKLPVVSGYSYNVVIDKINIELCNALRDNVSFINLKRLIAEVGIANAYNLKSKYRWNAPYSKVLVETAVKEIHKQYLIEKGITKKCLILDCDNVLWGGILSEDGIENLTLSGSGLGRIYQDFQRFVLSLYYHGVILAICSKNDLSNVLTMFREHSEMVLKEEQIACFQVNWEDKPSNIKIIAEKLNIGLDSIVFVDDSPIEIEAVKAILPEVNTILFRRDMNYESFSCFNQKNNNSITNIERRSETYRTNGFRKELKSKYVDYADYIKALQIKVDVHVAKPIEYARISELTQRVNKCTNGKRYTVIEIKERIASNTVKLYSVSVADCFCDLGLVGAIEIEGKTLTLFSLSCRALGREVEKKMIEFILDKYQVKKIEFRSTGKNEAIKILFDTAFPNVL